ncbi:MAG: GNAT family N-acetyltransferase [Spirochaetes bacterium GWD1_27_9]|nr:MAG: GNAT family N-acetyltransferase [Spirochaetes bacterium GWB1_27_13]OHD34492.1 MAG: GNAT family N-acetyltransferase [Spirochaetes bacterium GWD1_27_9]
MTEDIQIIDTNSENILKYGVCGYKNIKKPGFPEKFDWIKKNESLGLRIKTLYSQNDGTQGMIEYLPGEFCYRPVDASGYMFIHCIFVGFKNAYKNKGYASLLIEECVKDAKSNNLNGVAVVTREGSFMVGKQLFIKNGFEKVDEALPDFELYVKKLNKEAKNPKFNDLSKNLTKYSDGLTIIRANQCPYSIKNVSEIVETAKKDFGITPTVINLESYKDAQENPCAFGTFCIIYNGEIVSYHPISNTRFVNIMNKIIKK